VTTLLSVSALLAQHLGLEVGSIGMGTVAAAIGARAAAIGVDVDDYAMYPARDPRELAALVDEIVVPESWFFRDRIPFTHLASYVVERFRAGKARPFRILSAPCATGEEPYSIVMAMRDVGLGSNEVTVDAVDVSPPLLVAARKAEYRPVSFRGSELGFRDRYFLQAGSAKDPGGPTWVLSADIRASVTFKQVNLTSHGALYGEKPYDAIFCRNLLIYLTADARRALLSRFVELLGEHALLVVGHAEALELIDPRFRAVPVPGAFTYALRPPTDRVPAQRSASQSGSFSAATPMRRASDRAITQPVPAPIDDRATTKSAPLVRPTPPVDLIAQATALANRGDLAKAAELVEQHLVAAGADGKAWALLGTIKQASSDLARAEECFSRALYCDPGMYSALVSLALLLEKRGEAAGAANLRRRAERARPKEST
jgi:chemotaxis protein methyltransferase WspC